MTVDMGQVSKAHLAIRDARSALKKKFDDDDADLKGKQQKLEAYMLEHLNATNTNSVRTDAGTVYRQEKVMPSAADWTAIYDWIKANDAWEMLERRLKATFVKEYMEANNGLLPPGVNVHREYELRVRKA